MGAIATIYGYGGPAILENLYLRFPGVDHRLDRQNHTCLESRALAAGSEVGNLRVFVHAAADAVADKLADDSEALGFTYLLNRGGDVEEPATYLALFDGSLKGGLGDVE